MYQVRKSVKIKPDSFIVVVESHEVHGEGFKMTNIGEAIQTEVSKKRSWNKSDFF